MMSMWAKYQFERAGKQSIETDKGFVVYSVDGDVIYLEDIYVKPEFRKTRCGLEFADFIVKVGKSQGCSKLLGSVETKCKTAHESLTMLLYYGMKLHSVSGSLIYFIKDI